MRKTTLILLSIFLIILSSCSKGPKDCGGDAACIENAILNGEEAVATLTEESSQTGVSQGSMTVLIKSEGVKDGKHVVYQEVQNVDIQLPEQPELPEDATEGEKMQQELMNSVLGEMNLLVQNMQGTWVRCKLTPESLQGGLEDALNNAMEQSLDPDTLNILPNAVCEGSFLNSMANMLKAVQSLLQQALAPLAESQ